MRTTFVCTLRWSSSALELRTATPWGNLNLALLTTYVRVVEAGNFSAAARSLYVAQSVISAHIAALNRLAGTPLLERISGRWHPTAAGEIFLKRSILILSLVEQTRQDVIGASERIAGHLTIASTRTITDSLLADLLHAFSGAHPDIRVNVKAGNREEAERWIANDEVDLGLVAMPLGIKGLDIHPFATDDLVVVLPLGHPLAERESLTLADLANEPIVTFERGSGVRALLEERLGNAFSELDLRLELNSNDALLSCVERGFGVTFVPYRTARRWLHCGGVAIALLGGVDLRRELALVHRSERAPTMSVATFIRWVDEHYRDELVASESAVGM